MTGPTLQQTVAKLKRDFRVRGAAVTDTAQEESVGLISLDQGGRMALARVVTFDGVSKDRMDEMNREMESGQPPEGFPPAEIIALHDADAEKSLVVIIFDNEDDYRKGHEILDAMPAGDTPGQRSAVQKYNVAIRMKN